MRPQISVPMRWNQHVTQCEESNLNSFGDHPCPPNRGQNRVCVGCSFCTFSECILRFELFFLFKFEMVYVVLPMRRMRTRSEKYWHPMYGNMSCWSPCIYIYIFLYIYIYRGLCLCLCFVGTRSFKNLVFIGLKAKNLGFFRFRTYSAIHFPETAISCA